MLNCHIPDQQIKIKRIALEDEDPKIRTFPTATGGKYCCGKKNIREGLRLSVDMKLRFAAQTGFLESGQVFIF